MPLSVASEMPLPVCPLGEVTGLDSDSANAEPPAPGTSPLDEGLQALALREGGQP